jgi:hypothetical protein
VNLLPTEEEEEEEEKKFSTLLSGIRILSVRQ